jgi:hypothetical protein
MDSEVYSLCGSHLQGTSRGFSGLEVLWPKIRLCKDFPVGWFSPFSILNDLRQLSATFRENFKCLLPEGVVKSSLGVRGLPPQRRWIGWAHARDETQGQISNDRPAQRDSPPPIFGYSHRCLSIDRVHVLKYRSPFHKSVVSFETDIRRSFLSKSAEPLTNADHEARRPPFALDAGRRPRHGTCTCTGSDELDGFHARLYVSIVGFSSRWRTTDSPLLLLLYKTLVRRSRRLRTPRMPRPAR